MFSEGHRLFVDIPGASGESTLHAATILDASDEGFTAVSTDAVRHFEPGAACRIFFERNREFMQQPAIIEGFLTEVATDAVPTVAELDLNAGATLCVFGFRTEGEPVSAENRQCYRVSAVMYEVSADFGAERGCKVMDVSATGFAVMSATRHDPGAVLDTTLHFDGKSYTGRVCVQNVVEHHSGRFRHGLYSVRNANGTCDLEKGCGIINTGIQRMQLRRLKAAG